ncbi:hypothetical protein XAB3213_30050 [Xanthomonas citri pv. bilvae]|nr:hypothetical protein XAB3213_30050 [Xanthomonas citri pv. bilvae]
MVRSPILCTDTGGEQAKTYRVVVLGGFGHFGARIVRALAATAQIHVIAAGRRPGDAATTWPGVAPGRISTCRLDIDASDFSAQLAATGADAVVHTAGPFQGQQYAVARCCLQAACTTSIWPMAAPSSAISPRRWTPPRARPSAWRSAVPVPCRRCPAR